MNDDKFKEYVITKLDEIEMRITTLETMLKDYDKFLKLIYAVIVIIITLFGIRVNLV